MYVVQEAECGVVWKGVVKWWAILHCSSTRNARRAPCRTGVPVEVEYGMVCFTILWYSSVSWRMQGRAPCPMTACDPVRNALLAQNTWPGFTLDAVQPPNLIWIYSNILPMLQMEVGDDFCSIWNGNHFQSPSISGHTVKSMKKIQHTVRKEALLMVHIYSLPCWNVNAATASIN